MYADFAIHDTDGHNLHVHIILTVRPLDENGKWQHKTEKRIPLHMKRGGKNFTATKFKLVKNNG